MRETIREIDIEPKAAMALPAFAGGGADQRSVSRFFNVDLVANSRAPPWPARSRHGGQYDIELGQGRAHSRLPHSPHTSNGSSWFDEPGGWNVRASAQEAGPSGAAKWLRVHLLLAALLGANSEIGQRRTYQRASKNSG
jgi:hypothetical protein